MKAARQSKTGARCPIGAKLPPGRWAGLGGTCKAAHAARLQPVLPLYGQFGGSRGSEPGSFSADLPDAGELPVGVWRFPNVADERDAQFAGGSLPADASRPSYGLAGRRDAGARREAFVGARARQAGAGGGVERAIAAWAGEAFTGVARGGDPARFAGSGIQRGAGDTAGA